MVSVQRNKGTAAIDYRIPIDELKNTEDITGYFLFKNKKVFKIGARLEKTKAEKSLGVFKTTGFEDEITYVDEKNDSRAPRHPPTSVRCAHPPMCLPTVTSLWVCMRAHSSGRRL